MSFWQRSEEPNHPDNGPSRGDWLDMGHCPDCRVPEGKCLCDTEDTEALLRAEEDHYRRHG